MKPVAIQFEMTALVSMARDDFNVIFRGLERVDMEERQKQRYNARFDTMLEAAGGRFTDDQLQYRLEYDLVEFVVGVTADHRDIDAMGKPGLKLQTERLHEEMKELMASMVRVAPKDIVLGTPGE
jgi:hypothetical protein